MGFVVKVKLFFYVLYVLYVFVCFCVLGCISHHDCPEGKECGSNTNHCVPLTCKEFTSNVGGSIKDQRRIKRSTKDTYALSKWFVGDYAEFCCEEGVHPFQRYKS